MQEVKEALGLEEQEQTEYQVDFYCFTVSNEEEKKKYKRVGIYSPSDVGTWLVKTFRQQFCQKDMSDRLNAFLKPQATT